MKNFFSIALGIMILACNNQAGGNGLANDSTNAVNKKNEAHIPGSSDGNCGNNLLFQKGAEIHTSSYDGQGKETAKQVSTVKKVFQEAGMTVSELEMKNMDENGANEKTVNAIYKCDGKLLYVDLSGFLPGGKQNSDIKTSGLQFPFKVSVGETLPDADYSITMTSGDKTRKITSHIKGRKVEAKETVTTPAGSFECYRISSVIETDTEIPGMDEQSKKVMEEMKKKMGKNKMTFWYAPDVTIMKMEFYMGDKLITRSEVTFVKK